MVIIDEMGFLLQQKQADDKNRSAYFLRGEEPLDAVVHSIFELDASVAKETKIFITESQTGCGRPGPCQLFCDISSADDNLWAKPINDRDWAGLVNMVSESVETDGLSPMCDIVELCFDQHGI